ncbi:MOSC domain-containing protein [Neptunicella marina]|uniref:MOSC domain-containing protein n=1 Tax=Neptunicella marina TaxID=2125989 RepID=A0A8J6LWV3_9ALTE|nr:MOSC domain-containing protein [Neptunicella marina]MBC3764405.1 MOSC domain-containing protein [Neptunicella marina]
MIKLTGIAVREKSRAPMQSVAEANVCTEKGIHGDFRGKPGRRQVTVLSAEVWRKVCDELKQDIPWLTRRANLLVEGYEFTAADVGKRLTIGDLVLEICKETEPCPRMDEQVNGLTAALTPDWRGGVCCRVIQNGYIKLHDEIKICS